MDMPSLRNAPRRGRKRGGQFEKHGGEFHRVSLWRGRRWPGSKERGETDLGEAGSKQQI
jgi:hypothetical protein